MQRASAPSRSEPEIVGQRLLERYRVQERIARGGMSLVFRGWDERLRRPVCIKLFAGASATGRARRTVHDHFVREAFTLSQLQHPHTLRIYDFGRLEDLDQTPFQVSEFAEGGTLREHIRRHGPLPAPAALALLEPIAGALAEAHALDIVHRDIKPSNVLFVRAGAEMIVKLADFGIARSSAELEGPDPDDLPTRAEPVAAPPMYSLNWAAPEQLRGEAVGPEADVYALGLLTAYVLGGRVLFGGDDVLQLFEDRRGGDVLLLERLEALGLPTALTEVVARACRDAPELRTADVELFIDDLRAAALEPEPHVTAPLPAAGHTVLTPAVALDDIAPGERTVGTRRIRVLPCDAGVTLDWGDDTRPARVRVRRLEGPGGSTSRASTASSPAPRADPAAGCRCSTTTPPWSCCRRRATRSRPCASCWAPKRRA